MRLRSFFLSFVTVFLASASWAEEIQDVNELREYVKTYVSSYYIERYGHEKFKNDVEVTVNSIDSRLRLAKCDNNLTFKINEPPHKASNISVKTSCRNSKPWTIYVPVSIDIYTNIVTVKHSLNKGHILTKEDLHYKRFNVAKNGHGLIERQEVATGMELKRPINGGEAIRFSYLTKPDIIRKGQMVVMSSKSRFLSVETSGIALGNGHLGERIRVKNQSSNRVVEAQVVAPGKVVVAVR